MNLGKTNGWWNTIKVADLNGDGKPDLVLGNHGLNSFFKATPEKPVEMYVNDFDGNGTVEQILCAYNGDKSYPRVLRQNIVGVLPSLKKKFLYFRDYKQKTISDIFTSAQLKGALKLESDMMQSIVLINRGGKFDLQILPAEAQYAPVYAISVDDFDGDGIKDILLGGNFYRSKPEVGIYDASYGLLLKGDGKGGFLAVPPRRFGPPVKGETKDIVRVRTAKGKIALWGLNDRKPVALLYR